jgi:GntR family transcriptional regulator, histidine utilization repressor
MGSPMDKADTPLEDRDSSLHRRILSDIEERILSGAWPPGHRIPFEVDLARDYGCSRMTVNKVMTQLARTGLIERRKRLGSFVRVPTSQSAVLEIRDIASEVAALGVGYHYRLLSRRRRRATADERARLGLEPGAEVLHVVALHAAGGEPFCLEDRLINLEVVPEAASETFEAEAPGVFLIRRVPWSAAEHVVRAVAAAGETARRLGLAAGAPCLAMERRTASGSGFVTHVTLTYPGHRHALHARFEPATGGAGGG